ncbi:MAG: histidine phosphatase family protein [Desulfovibrio sp.]|jgi:probable phosphoglycerate mutase|nr:histidine phosphatase family protein [Desulfovibrio sp.]
MRRLIIVRHGNTFQPGEIPTRVGKRTDLPLVENDRARKAGRLLRLYGCIPDRVFAAPLQRTLQTARLILREMELSLDVRPAPSFTEIDYGPDENQPEHHVQLRLGRHYLEQAGLDATHISVEQIRLYGERVIRLWDTLAIPPQGWQMDTQAIIAAWRALAAAIEEGETVLLISSNGIIRFAPHLLPDTELACFTQQHELKVSTGGICIFARDAGSWRCLHWNLKTDDS